MKIHIYSGVVIVLLTVFFTVTGVIKAGKIKPQTHAYVGLVLTVLCVLEAVLGYVSFYYANSIQW
jgi:RsiW-degrading membrane proteinase PrsW (M82 family)